MRPSTPEATRRSSARRTSPRRAATCGTPIAGRDDYLLGSPLVTRAQLAIGGGTFTIEAPEASDRAPYIREARLDGEALSEPRFLHSSIVPGGRLELDMRAAP